MQAADRLKLRWLNGQCYEIHLASGKVILTDPLISDPVEGDPASRFYRIPKECGITLDSITQVDYLIINHTHCDHIADVGNIVKKFNPMVICPEQAAYELAKMFDIPFTQMYAVGIGETHEFPDFTLYTMHGSHMPQAFTYSTMPNILKVSYGMDGPCADELGQLGGMIDMNFCLITRENLRIGFLAGRMDSPWEYPALKSMARLQPNVLIRQIPARLQENPAPDFANDLKVIGAELMLPMHHEKFDISMPDFLDSLIDETNEIAHAQGCHGTFRRAYRGKWFSMGVSVEDE